MTDQMPAIVSYAQPEVMQPIPEKRTVTKRDGSKEPFDASKLVKWSLWGKERIEHPIAWQDAVREVSEESPPFRLSWCGASYIRYCLEQAH